MGEHQHGREGLAPNPQHTGRSDVAKRRGLFMPTTMPKVNLTGKREARQARRAARRNR